MANNRLDQAYAKNDAFYRKMQNLSNEIERLKHNSESTVDKEVLHLFTKLCERQADLNLILWEMILEIQYLEERLFDPTSRNSIWMDSYRPPKYAK